MDPTPMARMKQRIDELEKRNKELEKNRDSWTLFVEAYQVVLDLHFELQDQIFASWGPEAGSRFKLAIRDRIRYSESRFCLRCNANHETWIRDMCDLIPHIERLLEFSDGENAVVNAYAQICCAELAPTKDAWYGTPEILQMFWELDDHGVHATLQLLRDRPLPGALAVADTVVSRKGFLPRPADTGHAERFAQLLREISVVQVARLTTERALVLNFGYVYATSVSLNLILL